MMLARLLCVYLAFVKTPISYPGGKSRAVKKLYEFVSEVQFDTYVEPFLGGGSFALYITQMRPDVKVVVNDAFRPLYCFWKILRDRPEELTKELLKKRKEVSSEQECRELYALCHRIMDKKSSNNFDQAVSFYIANKMAYGGLMRGDTFSIYNSVKKFNCLAIGKLDKCSEVIKSWKIKCRDYEKIVSTRTNEKTLIYLDPPYEIASPKLYGKGEFYHKNFCHSKFIDSCERWKKSNSLLMVSYNQEMVGKFPEWNQEVFPLWYSMQTSSTYQAQQSLRNELLLTNFERGFTNGAL